MKKIFTLACLACMPAIVQAQITINQASYTFWEPDIDTVKKTSGVNAMQAMGSNQQWDLSTATYDADSTVVHIDNVVLNPPSEFQTNIRYAVGDFVLDAQTLNTIDANGYKFLGEQVLNRQAYPIVGPGSVPTDSVVFPPQVETYSAPRTILQFPTMSNSVWTNSYVIHTDFTLTYQAAMYNQTPGYINAAVTTHDTVTGWGTMRVKRYDGSNSDWVNVLQVRSHKHQVDTFYANNALIPDMLLAYVGTKQQDTTDSYHIRYYRVGEVTPLAELRYTDETYSTLDQVLVHTDNLPAGPTAVSNIEFKNAISIYPNPVANRELTISVANAKGTWSYELMNAIGQTVSNGNLLLDNGAAKLALDKNISAGTYYLRLAQYGDITPTQPIIVQ